MTDDEIKNKVKTLLHDNIKAGYSEYLKRHFFFIKPSRGKYPFQWWWDTFFQVIILCKLEEYDLAKLSMESLFALQRKDGFVGHMTFWESLLPRNKSDIIQAKPRIPRRLRPYMSELIQPTLAAYCLYRIYEGTKDLAFLEDMLPKVKKYYDWLSKNRDLDKDGLISIISPFESGMDWKPPFDEVVGFKGYKPNFELYWRVHFVDLRNFLNGYNISKIKEQRYFTVKEITVNVFYAIDLRYLSNLCRILKDSSFKLYDKMSQKAEENILSLMYDGETSAFYDVFGKHNLKTKTLTASTFLPLVLQNIPQKICSDIVKKHLNNNKEFNTKYPIPSVALTEKSFDPKEQYYLWRGPTWILYNWFIYKCLREKGFEKEAARIFRSVKDLIEIGGFREYYNPFTGEGYGAKDFTWSGLVVDMMD